VDETSAKQFLQPAGGKGDKIFPETDETALPSGIVAAVVRDGDYVKIAVTDGRTFTYHATDAVFSATGGK